MRPAPFVGNPAALAARLPRLLGLPLVRAAPLMGNPSADAPVLPSLLFAPLVAPTEFVGGPAPSAGNLPLLLRVHTGEAPTACLFPAHSAAWLRGL